MRALPGVIALALLACSTTEKPIAAEVIASGSDLITRMHARWSKHWYNRLRVEQEVIFHDEKGTPVDRQVWTEYIQLPGKVRCIVGDEAEGNGELYVNGAFHIIRDGLTVRTAPQPHPVLLIGYDVYRQEPATTTRLLTEAGFDLAVVGQTVWRGRRVWIVGAEVGDEQRNQFWIDAERLLCARIITRSPRGALYDIRFTDYERFAGAWLCTELMFYRDGELLIHERDLGHSIPEEIEAARFVPPPPAETTP